MGLFGGTCKQTAGVLSGRQHVPLLWSNSKWSISLQIRPEDRTGDYRRHSDQRKMCFWLYNVWVRITVAKLTANINYTRESYLMQLQSQSHIARRPQCSVCIWERSSCTSYQKNIKCSGLSAIYLNRSQTSWAALNPGCSSDAPMKYYVSYHLRPG